MKEKLYSVKLRYENLIHLDGANVPEDTQKIIDDAKDANKFGFDLPLMNEALLKSIQTGTLKWTRKPIRYCPICAKTAGYAKYPRNSRHHRKGDPNYDRPLTFSGYAFNEGFVTIRHSGDICIECSEKHDVVDRLCNYIVENDLPIEIKNKKELSLYTKDDIRICYKCEEEMRESQMGKERTLMGDGFYPATCPNCGAKSLPFGRSHGSTNKFVMVKSK
jgi:hypothetical protein